MGNERRGRILLLRIARATVLAAAALLLWGCTVSLGVTNSPPTPDQCGPGRTPC